MSPTVPTQVVSVDLDRDSDEIGSLPFSEFQRTRLAPYADGIVDASRTLITSSVTGIENHSQALERIIGASSVERVIALIRGHGQVGVDRPIRVSSQLDLAPVATLWVDDARGVVWGMRTAKARALTLQADDPDGDATFEALITCLSSPEVFDRVFAEAKELDRIASPGLRIYVPGATDVRLNEAAEVAAWTTLTSEGSGDLDRSLDDLPIGLEARANLFGRAPAPAEFFDAQGRIGQLSRTIDARLAEVDAAVTAITDRPPVTYGPIERANDAVHATGQALGELKDALTELFTVIDGSNGLDVEEVRRLRAAGLRSGSTKAHRGETTDDLEGVLRTYAVTELRRSRSLQTVVAELRRVHDRATPRESEETIQLLDQVAPDEAIERLSNHPALRVSISDPKSLLLIFLAFVGGGAMWGATWVAVALALVGLAAFLALVTRPVSALRSVSVQGLKAFSRAAHLYLVGASSLLGLIVGLVIRHEEGPLLIHLAGALLAVAALGGLAAYAWRAASQRWLAAADPSGAAELARNMLELTADVAMNDWVMAEPRVRFAEVAGKLASSLEGLRVALLGDLAPTQPAGTAEAPKGPPSEEDPRDGEAKCNPAVRADLAEAGGAGMYKHGSELAEIVFQDYLDTIAAAIESSWPQIALGDQQVGESAVREEFTRRLETYRRDLRRNGLFGRRVALKRGEEDGLTAAGRARRRDLLTRLWADIDLTRLLAHESDADLVQLCSPESLVLLGQDPADARVVRFAPATATDGTTRSVTRTASMLVAGVLRLVPLREGTVQYSERPFVEEQPDAELSLA